MAFAEEIIARLQAEGVGTYGSVIFSTSAAVIPDGPGPYLTVIQTGGFKPAQTHTNATQRPTAQLLARALAATSAQAMARAAYAALGGPNGLHNVTLSGTWYVNINPRQEPTDIGLDKKGRLMMAFNIEVEKAPSSS